MNSEIPTTKSNYPQDQVNKNDLALILEVNKKTIEIKSEVAIQNEEIIDLLGKISDNQEVVLEKVSETVKKIDTIDKDIFKIQVLFITGLLSLVIQIIQMFIKK